MSFNPAYLDEAIALAVDNVRSGRGGPFGALVVGEGRILGRGTNLVTSTNDPTAHAEINAIREACRTLGTFRLERYYLYSSCEPCPMCLGAIYWARLGGVYYGATRDDAARADFDDAAFYQEFLCQPGDRSIRMERRETIEALRPFEEWRLRDDRARY